MYEKPNKKKQIFLSSLNKEKRHHTDLKKFTHIYIYIYLVIMYKYPLKKSSTTTATI